MTFAEALEVFGMAAARGPLDRVALRRRYRELAKAHHPDRRPDDPLATARFRRIEGAYRILLTRCGACGDSDLETGSRERLLQQRRDAWAGRAVLLRAPAPGEPVEVWAHLAVHDAIHWLGYRRSDPRSPEVRDRIDAVAAAVRDGSIGLASARASLGILVDDLLVRDDARP